MDLILIGNVCQVTGWLIGSIALRLVLVTCWKLVTLLNDCQDFKSTRKDPFNILLAIQSSKLDLRKKSHS